MYCASPKKQLPQTNQLTHMQMVFSLRFGVRNKCVILYFFSFCLSRVLTLPSYASIAVLTFSIGILFLPAALTKIFSAFDSLPTASNHLGDSGIIL